MHRDDVRPLSHYEEVNVEGTRKLCTVAEENGIERIVFASAVTVYGLTPPGIDESGKIAPFNEHGRTKYEAERVLSNNLAQPYSQLLKRCFDILAASAILVFLAPLAAVIALLVRREGRPIFFAHTRIGRHGQLFKCRIPPRSWPS